MDMLHLHIDELRLENEHLATFQQSYQEQEKQIKNMQKEIDNLQKQNNELLPYKQESYDLQNEIERLKFDMDEKNLVQ